MSEPKRVWGDDPMDWAGWMASMASMRALQHRWEKNPMCGIETDTDKWAVAYQEAKSKLKAMLQKP